MTLFTEIYDLFLVMVRDYKLDKLYDSSTTDFETYLKGFLMKAIPKFTNTKQPLTYTGTSFDNDLTVKENDILSTLMCIEWLTKEVNDVTQFTNSLNDTDFKRYSESQNLTSKKARYNDLREIVNQDMVDYDLKTTDWESWRNGSYGV